MTDLVSPTLDKDYENSDEINGKRSKEIDWEVSEDKRAAREKSLWSVYSPLHFLVPFSNSMVDFWRLSVVSHYHP